MTDVHTKVVRSYKMSRIRGMGTRPEMVVRKFLFAYGIWHRLYDKKLPGKPDIVIRKYKAIIDIRGCFWQGQQNCKFGDNMRSESIGITERIRSDKERDKINEQKW